MAALRTLPPLDRAVVVLRYWEDRSVDETARALHLSPAAVKNRSLRALARLRTTLTDPELHELATSEASHDPH
jgi:RNA polymerase sigma factor (sigma-70 family)